MENLAFDRDPTTLGEDPNAYFDPATGAVEIEKHVYGPADQQAPVTTVEVK